MGYDTIRQTITAPTTLGSVANTEYFIFTDTFAGSSTITNRTENRDTLWGTETRAILHFDGANNGSTITDNSYLQGNWYCGRSSNNANAGTAGLSTAKKKFGTASFYQTGDNYIGNTIASGTLGHLHTSINWTAEFWFHPNNTDGAGGCLYCWNGGDGAGWPTPKFRLYYYTGNVIRYYREHDSGTVLIDTTTTLNKNDWNHIALVKDTGTIKVFVNGVLGGSATDNLYIPHYQYYPLIGCEQVWWGITYFQTGYYDDYRFTYGTARYTANFTPPTMPHPNSYSDPFYTYEVLPASVGSPTLPTAIGNSNIYHIKNINQTTNIVVNTSLSQQIENQPNWTLKPNDSISLVSSGTSWRIF